MTTIPTEFWHAPFLSYLAIGFMVASLVCFAPQVTRSGQMFLAIGLALLFLAMVILDDWQDALLVALSRASFIAAFFTALSTIRSAAITDTGILECGRFLVNQPPGRRYLALTLGGNLFGLLLTYGSISLLGTLAKENADREPNLEIRGHRTRRVLIAIQRGFISTLPWSPLAFASAITLPIVPGATWSAAAPLTIVSGFILAGTGWALDTAFKPRLSIQPPLRGPAEGQWFSHMKPLYFLLATLVSSTAVVHFLTGVRIFGVVMTLVPLTALIWVAVQHSSRIGTLPNLGRRALEFTTTDIPKLKSEIVILVMAGFIGSLGAATLSPLMTGEMGSNLAAVPTWLLLLCIFWIVPITGQFGMNPILSVSLFAPFLPTPEVLGVDPAIVVCAITSGWALSGVTSPFTASVLLVAALGKVSPTHVGLHWNGLYAFVCGIAMSLWLLLLKQML
ncbi:hypothetical protein [Yoonia sp. MH D7]